MNNEFMFSPKPNPCDDNAKFLKNALTVKHCVFIAIGTAVMLVCLVYSEIYTYNMMTGDTALFESSNDRMLSVFNFFVFGTKILFLILAVSFLFFGAVNFIVNLNDKESSYLPNSLANMGIFFFICCIIYNLLAFLFSFLQLGFILLSTDYDTTDVLSELGKILFADTFLSAVFIVWSISGLIFCSSVRKTLKGVTLSDKGAVFFTAMSVINVCVNIAAAMLYNATQFDVGVFYSFDGSNVLSDAVKYNTTGVFMFNLFFVALIVTIISASLFAKNYRNAIMGAKRSLSGYPAYFNMNDNGVADYYTSPEINLTNQRPANFFDGNIPPQNVGNMEYQHIDFPVKNEGNPGFSGKIIICNMCGANNDVNRDFCCRCGNVLRK